MTVKIVPERPAPHPYPLTAAQTRDVYYSYDLRGLQLFARFDSASGEGVTNAWDGFGRLASSTITFTYFYPHGAPSILDRPNIAPTYFNYDPVQRLSRIVHTYAGWVGNADWTWTRNPAGQIAGL